MATCGIFYSYLIDFNHEKLEQVTEQAGASHSQNHDLNKTAPTRVPFLERRVSFTPSPVAYPFSSSAVFRSSCQYPSLETRLNVECSESPYLVRLISF